MYFYMISDEKMAKIIIYLVLVLANDALTNKLKSIPCTFHRQRRSATCNSRRLQYIPRLPDFVTKVKFVGNNFTFINGNFFRNLTSFNRIVALNLTDNLIQHISENAFENFSNLLSFGISKEPQLNITTLKNSFNSLPKTLLFLELSGNGWREIPLDMFLSFTYQHNPSFNLSLTWNNIRSIDARVFTVFKNLKSLNLAWNSIKNVTLNSILTVQEINLNMNYVSDIPAWCDSNNRTLVPNLRILHLSENSIAEMDQSSFKCLESLEKLGLDANNFRALKSNTFSELKSLKTLYISENTRLKVIEDFAFNVTSLQFLYFRDNHF